MAPDDSDDKSPSSDGIARKEEDTATPADDATGETPVVHIEETTTAVRWEAPLPPPALLEEYDRVVPGLAGRIADQARDSESHIREIEKKALTAAVEYRTRGQWMGFAALLAILGISQPSRSRRAPRGWRVSPCPSSPAPRPAAFVLGTLKKRDGKQRGE